MDILDQFIYFSNVYYCSYSGLKKMRPDLGPDQGLWSTKILDQTKTSARPGPGPASILVWSWSGPGLVLVQTRDQQITSPLGLYNGLNVPVGLKSPNVCAPDNLCTLPGLCVI